MGKKEKRKHEKNVALELTGHRDDTEHIWFPWDLHVDLVCLVHAHGDGAGWCGSRGGGGGFSGGRTRRRCGVVSRVHQVIVDKIVFIFRLIDE